MHGDWWGGISWRHISLKPWSRILHQHPVSALEQWQSTSCSSRNWLVLLHVFEFWNSSAKLALPSQLSTNRVWFFSIWVISTNSALYVLDLLRSWGSKMLLRRDLQFICLCLTVAAEGMLIINLVSLRLFSKMWTRNVSPRNGLRNHRCLEKNQCVVQTSCLGLVSHPRILMFLL